MKKLVVFICCVFIAFSSLLAKDVVVGAERFRPIFTTTER
jgi:hypothetical protein